MPPALASVAIRLNSSQFALHLFIAGRLKERYGSKIHVYVRWPVEVQGLTRDYPDPVWDSISAANALHATITEPVVDESALFEKARHYEQLTGYTINRIMMGTRQLNRGFSLGGFRSQRRRSFLKASYAQRVNAIVASLSFWEREIREKNISLVIDGDMEAAVMARALGVPYRRLHFARYKNRQFWAPDLHQSNLAIGAHYEAMTDDAPLDFAASYGAATTKTKAKLDQIDLLRMFRTVPQHLAERAYRKLRGQENVRDVTLLDLVRVPFQNRRRYRHVMRLAKTTLKDLTGKRFAYFPLHKEPEIALNQAAPELTSQQALVISVARDLPAGVLLAVKDHIVSIGNRPDGFYEQIAALPNVVLLSPHENPIAAVKQADVTIAVFGTAGLEAAAMGRPVISFARQIPWGILPHVTIITGEEQLQPMLERILNGQFDHEKALKDGARFIRALIASSFDMGNFRVDRSRTRGALPEHAEVACDALVNSLRIDDLAAAAE